MAEISIGELARRSGVAVSAIHFYERKGLIESRRTAGNQRRYEREALRRIAIVKIAQQLGIPLADIARMFAALPQQGRTTRRDWQGMSRRWAADLDRRIALLQSLRHHLDDCIGCGCLSLQRCGMLNPGDALASQGSGPIRLKRRGKD
ncbi:MAG: redox-sensitive transcriptional activator SoxR [Proteobacteria bacterium]|nr:redox-sensitive transcriptional activator SoxR [Pseudomonadota bacterium]